MKIIAFKLNPDARLGQSPEHVSRISPRQAEVLELAEFTAQEIADQIGCRMNTVKTHLRALYNTSGAETRAQLVSWRERQIRRAA